MNCIWQDDSAPSADGWRSVRCIRPGCRFNAKPLNPTPHPHDKIHATCTGFPLWHEVGEWAGILIEAITGLNPHRWVSVKHRLGLIEPADAKEGCGCEARKLWLNTLGGRLSQRTDWLGRLGCRLFVKSAPPQPPPDAPRS